MDELQISPSKRLGGLGRQQRRRLREFLADWVADARRHRRRLVVLAGPTAVGKGTVAGVHPRAPPRRAALGLGDDARAAPRRGGGRELLLRRRRRVRPHDRRGRAARVGDRAQRLPLRHPARRRSRTPRRGQQRAAGDRHPGRPLGAPRDAGGDAGLPAAADAGTNSCAGWSAAAPRARPNSSADSRPRRSNWRPSTSSITRSSTTTSARRRKKVVDLMRPRKGRRRAARRQDLPRTEVRTQS